MVRRLASDDPWQPSSLAYYLSILVVMRRGCFGRRNGDEGFSAGVFLPGLSRVGWGRSITRSAPGLGGGCVCLSLSRKTSLSRCGPYRPRLIEESYTFCRAPPVAGQVFIEHLTAE